MTCTSGSPARLLGAWRQVIEADAISEDFDITGIQFLVNTATQYCVQIGIGASGYEGSINDFRTDTQAVDTEYASISTPPSQGQKDKNQELQYVDVDNERAMRM